MHFSAFKSFVNNTVPHICVHANPHIYVLLFPESEEFSLCVGYRE